MHEYGTYQKEVYLKFVTIIIRLLRIITEKVMFLNISSWKIMYIFTVLNKIISTPASSLSFVSPQFESMCRCCW